MSLRDQLLAKGLVSKKDARRVDQQQREERKQAQGHRRRQAELEAEQRAAQERAEQREKQQRLEEKRRREAERERIERELRVRQIVRDNRIRSRGPFRFFHRTLDPKRLGRMDLSEGVAWKLRCGEAAIAALQEGEQVDYVVISARAAQKLEEFAPELVVTHVKDTTGLSDPAEGLWKPEWDVSLRPHRVREG